MPIDDERGCRLEPGTMFQERYRIVRLLGEGAMGAVYEVECLKDITQSDRNRAIKVIHSKFASNPHYKERLYREAKALKSLNCEYIPKLFEAMEEGGQPYLVMELLQGKDLRKFLRALNGTGQIKLPIERAIRLACDACDALGAAHRRNLVHRDIKPENIFITVDDKVKLLDFGVAMVIEGPTAPQQSSGYITGSAPYMSPEQLECAPIKPSSDIFSLGVVLYEVLSGKFLFPGNDLGKQRIEREPARITKRLIELKEIVPKSLVYIIKGCLRHDPSHFYGRTKDLRNDLSDFYSEWRRQPELQDADALTTDAYEFHRAALFALFGGIGAV